MRLKVFDIIDDTLKTLEKNQLFYELIENEIRKVLLSIFISDERMVDINSRIKSKGSLREKIIRNRFYMQYQNGDDILNHLSDLIGFIIECRFIEDEFQIFTKLHDTFCINKDEQGYYAPKENKHFYLDINAQQPQIQKNGFAIYRIDGYYQKGEKKVHMELQIKALVHSFWGEIEHKLVYKNTNYYVYDHFMKDLLASIKANLTITDRQLHIMYNQMQQESESGTSFTEANFENLISKAINDLFAFKMSESIGFAMNLKKTSTIIGRYIYLKDIEHNIKDQDHISTLFKTFRLLNLMQLDFEHELKMEQQFASEDIFIHLLGSHLISIMNKDYDWFVFFQMLFAIEAGNNIEDFTMFLNVVKNYLVDHYWLHTSFVKLASEESQFIHQELLKMLALSLIDIGTIDIIHDDKMRFINQAFVAFVNELESRVISHQDFMEYLQAYQEEWKLRLHKIF